MIENPILSDYHTQDKTYAPAYVSDCTNSKCNEDIYSNEGYEYNGQLFCGTHCIGEHLVNEGIVVDLSQGY